MKGGKSFYSIHLSEYECYFYYNLLTKGARLNVGDFVDIFNAGMLHMRKELKYKQRLDAMEKKTMVMLVVTGGGTMGVLLLSMLMLFGI